MHSKLGHSWKEHWPAAKMVKRAERPTRRSTASNFARVTAEATLAQGIYWGSFEIEKGQRSCSKHDFEPRLWHPSGKGCEGLAHTSANSGASITCCLIIIIAARSWSSSCGEGAHGTRAGAKTSNERSNQAIDRPVRSRVKEPPGLPLQIPSNPTRAPVKKSTFGRLGQLIPNASWVVVGQSRSWIGHC